MSEELKEVIDVEDLSEEGMSGRRSDGGVYLVIADDSEEFPMALHYAARRAHANRAHIGILHVITIEDFQHWGKVENIMKKELREKAEKFIWNAAKKTHELNNMMPCLYLKEGNTNDVIVDVINEDPSIRMMVLAGGTNSGGPGPLVSHFTSKGLSRLRVPLVIVPGHLDNQKIDDVAL